MHNIIESLYDGDICPAENARPQTPEYQALNDHFSELWQIFFQSIPPESKGLFFELEDKMYDLEYHHLRSAFADGFRMGVKIILESTE